eukprot:jgi/Mesen1/7762/ME000408S06874
MALTLRYPTASPPLAILAAAAIAGVETSSVADTELGVGVPPVLTISTGEELTGNATLLRYFGRVNSELNLYGSDPLLAGQVDEWIEYAPILAVGAEFERTCAYINSYLTLRTFLVGCHLSIADILVWTGLAAGEERASEGPADIQLPGAEMGKVCTRFPPEPSGFLHIGHAKAALMNKYFAEKYGGTLIIRFDDTNPSKEKDEFVENILADLATLGVKGDRLTYTSDYFDELQAMAEKLMREGKAYVDDTPQERMRAERMDGIDSAHRESPLERNLALWEEMRAGSTRGRECCLRGKLEMQAPNKAMRDPVYYRCNPAPHHRTGDKYKMYPTYDFACPYVDALEGVTHALRSSEYHDRNEQYYRVLQDMGLRKVHVWDFSRLNFQYTLLSKRKLQWFVDEGLVDGWDDPRFPTVQGITRRGLTVETLKQFILSQGASKNLNLMEWDKLWTMNKKFVDPTCPRHTAVQSAGRVLLTLADGPAEPFVRVVPRHKKHPPAGSKATSYTRRIWLDQSDALAISEGEEVTLMDWGNAIVEKIERDEASGTVTGLQGRLHLAGLVKATKLKLTWLPEIEELVPLSLVEIDHLITKKKLEEDDDYTKLLNSRTRWETAAIGDANMRNIKKGEILQLERKGYFICDAPYIRASKPLVLIAIPDGRQKPAPGGSSATSKSTSK